MEKRKPGRPKKGNASWKPATELATLNKSPNYVYRYVNDEPERIRKLEQEQWELCNRVTDREAHIDAHEEHDAVTGGMKYRELVLMRMPKSTKRQRDRYYQDRANQQERAAKEDLQRELRKGGKAEAHGTIIID